ncbi:MAG: aldehyde dehydrogenase [Caulobacterales bacterium]|nr:aldehyde dehydrogenase [Caulobacterales bacterium]
MHGERQWPIAPRVPPIIGGREEERGERLAVVDPATEERLTDIIEADAAAVDRAVTAARAAFDDGEWSRASLEVRQRALLQMADIVEAHADELAWLECRNIGAPIAQCRGRHVVRAILNFRFFAEYISQTAGETYAQQGDVLTLVTREPVGVAALIGPWNAPLALTSMKIAAAIAFGNSCVVKPSEIAPLSVHRLVELLETADPPPGVINLINGRGPVTGAALAGHPDIDLLSFTGGTAVGQTIMAAAGANLTPVTLELGGKSANIIFADADLERALDSAILSIYANNGQQCLAGSRILLQRPIAERFMDAFAARAEALRIGDPTDPATEIGPLATKAQFDRVLSYVDTARCEGCELLVGGRRAEGFSTGYYLEPTAVLAPGNRATVCQEEIFGPFATFQIFDEPEQAWRIANDTRFGLNAYVWTARLDTAMSAHRALRAGTINVNSPIIRELRAPFGGFKQSGVGRESGAACEAFYTEEKTTTLPCADMPIHRMGTGS